MGFAASRVARDAAFLTRNEVSVSRERKGVYFLYRVFGFRDDPRLFIPDFAGVSPARKVVSRHAA
ncbi:MAG: DUF3883 domain-containing protein [Candidatus Eisenbacteria bacterium]|nr:DUF3883 domain-containing protein [Candidatus Eisenbacteria bacterium]